MSAAETVDWAAMRDASWYDRPDVSSDKKVHLNGRVTEEDVMSRCGRSILDDDGLTWAPAEVAAHLRCRSNGCRQGWPS